ncbi:MAG: alpha/beta hydrolase fold domain-containing protein [Clostridia bacterium]|nr:alpha/beta hydrolase fold domain-containing protein [Clostridia bacterium]
MSKKTKIFLIVLIILGLLLSLIYKFIVSYYFEYDRETIEPNEEAKICSIETQEFQNRKIFMVYPKESKTDLTIMYFHGGSYMAEATKEHWDFIQKLAIDTNSTVIMPDYPLAPKANYKDVFEFAEPFYKETIENIDANKLIVMGDSAGGGLALGLMEKISSEDIKIPNKIMLISPWLDTRLTNPDIDEVQKRDKQLNKETLKLAGIAYSLGDDNYLVNPIDGDLSKLKNITIFIGKDDILNPDVYVLKNKALEQGIELEVKEYENANHIWVIDKNSDEQIVNKRI